MLWSGDGRGGGGGPSHALLHVLQRRILLLLPLTLLLLLQLVTHQLGKTVARGLTLHPISPRVKVASDYGRVQREESCAIPAYADQCVRPWLGGEGAEEGEPMSMHHSPAREVDEAVEEKKREEKT